MAVFSYIGTDQTQATVRGTVRADTARQARDVLREQGIRVRKIAESLDQRAQIQKQATFSLPSLGMAKQSTSVIAELSMLLHAGVPLLDAFDTITDQYSGRFRSALLSVRERVAAGESLASAMQSRPDLFDETTIQMVEVGENAGTLETVLSQVADFKQRQSRFTDAVTTALVYPAFLVCFGTAAGIFLMTGVLPPLLENLEETLPALPWPTRVAKRLSETLIDYRWWWIIGTSILAFLLAGAVKTPRWRSHLDQIVVRVPLLGPMIIKQNVSRIAMVIATLSRSGVELTKAFDLAARSVRNTRFRDALKQTGERIAAGQEIAEALSVDNVFPPLAIRVFSVGQESGKLDEMLFRLADDYDEQVKTTSARLTALVEPVLILVLAVMVGFLLLATILPILEAGNVL
ncbi:type II secretion system F family protein [Stieleria sp. JC731]|uniref:type II secretion system F family protein n=1 Tax=Pirellulaceae TaxID=2691357 RepID=UPI001E473DCD|nr:type II secretion system F family protein [Stieleria sp. JC731]MCC9599474.1 type II secretion system F family protein [Stieleria sp. JC731]